MEKPTVVSIVAVGGRGDTDLLSLAAGAARALEPPFGAAILASAHERDVQAAIADSVPMASESGVVASIGGHTVVVGNAALFSGLGLSLETLGDSPRRLEQHGQRVLFVAVDGRAAGFLGVIDAAL
jgi:Cu+-exporting ATPase